MRRSRWVLLLVAACGPVASPAPPLRPKPAVEPQQTASEEGRVVATLEIRPLKRSKFLSARDVDVFNDVCQLVDGEEGAGCTCCPLSDRCADIGGPPFATIEHVFHGAFSAPDVEEVFATGRGCGNLSAWGVTWFLRHDGTRWQPVRGESNTYHLLHGATWRRADGRRGLVAHDEMGKMGDEAIVFLTFDHQGKPTRHPLLTWANPGCAWRVPGFYASVVEYVGANAVDHDRDGKRDLVVALDVRRRFVDEAFGAECGAWYEAHDKGPSPIEKMPAKRVAVPLLFDGATFTPEPKALATLEALTAVVDEAGNAPSH